MTQPRTLTNKPSRGQTPVSVNQTDAAVEETLKQINYSTSQSNAFMKAQLFLIGVFRLLNQQSAFALSTNLLPEKNEYVNGKKTQRWMNIHTTY